jgi:hypothetical protein
MNRKQPTNKTFLPSSKPVNSTTNGRREGERREDPTYRPNQRQSAKKINRGNYQLIYILIIYVYIDKSTLCVIVALCLAHNS